MERDQRASWMRSEHDLLEKLADELRHSVAVIPRTTTDHWIRETRDHFDHFRIRVQDHMDAEEQNGYMDSILERRPTLSARVERLEQEHRDITMLMDDLQQLASELSANRRLLTRDFCQRVQSLIAYIDHHEDEENDLVEFAFTDDIGTKD